jgi:drug/metabolite transporter (DMT)-like permease
VSRRGWLLFAFMGLVWGFPYLLIKVAVDEVSVPVVVFTRCALGALLLLPLALRNGQFAVLRRHWKPIGAFAVIEIIGPWALLADAERELDSALAGLLIAVVPVLGAVLARLVGDERLSRRRWAGLALGLGGVALLAVPQLRGGGSAWSVTEVLLTALGYAIAPMIVARRLRQVPTLQLTVACLTVASVVYAVPAFLTRPAALPSTGALVSLAALGAVCTALGFLLFFELIREVGTARAMVFTYVNPAVTATAGVLVLGEPLTAAMLGAFVLILGGSYLATARHAEPGTTGRRVPWSARQTSRAGGRVGALQGAAEERPGSTGQGGG